ncbi:MAG: cysteine peptidase family C39 domain-containing protein [Planctomycetota bacterium]
MLSTPVWFAILAAVALLSWGAGWWAAQRSAALGRVAVAVGLAWLVGWIVLQQRPDAAVLLIPLGMLSHVEGTGAVPAFMLIVGAAMAAASLPRQRMLARVSTVVGAAFFAYAGMWMLQPEPTLGTPSRQQGRILQSTDYTCVAAASATALGMVGIDATEHEMAGLTGTRPIAGSTLVRAYEGLTRKLADHSHEAVLLTVQPDEVPRLPKPMLTALRLQPTSRHMVVVLNATETDVHLFDPSVGDRWLSRGQFDASFLGDVIVLAPRDR